MRKRFSCLIMSLLLAVLAVVTEAVPVAAETYWEEQDQTSVTKDLGLESGLLSLDAVEEGANGVYTKIEETELEIGDQFLLGLKVDKTKLTGNLNIIQSFRAQLIYDTTYFEIIQNGDLAVVDTAVTSAKKDDSSAYRYARGWDKENSIFRLTVKNPSEENNPDGYVLVIRLTVKRAVNEICDFTLKNIFVYGNEGAVSSNTGYYATDGVDVQCHVRNSMYGHRKIELASTRADDLGNLQVAVGKPVSVPVYVEENTGFNTLKIRTTFSTDVLKFVSVSLSPELRTYADLSVDSINSNTVNVSVVSTHDIKLDNKVKLIDFNFEVLGTATKGSTSVVEYKIVGVSNESMTTMSGASYDENEVLIPNGPNNKDRTVQIKASNLRGDINEDEKVTLVDAAYLLQYYNGVRSLSDYQVTLGDVNNSGTITLVDVLMIMKRYNSQDTTGWVELTA